MWTAVTQYTSNDNNSTFTYLLQQSSTGSSSSGSGRDVEHFAWLQLYLDVKN